MLNKRDQTPHILHGTAKNGAVCFEKSVMVGFPTNLEYI